MRPGMGMAAALLLVSGAARAGTYVVDHSHAGAGDENPGTAEAPFKTIGKALAAVKSGDTVLVRPGEYAEAVAITSSGTEEQPITLRADGPGEVTLLGGLVVKKAAHVRVSGFTLTWPKQGGPTNPKTNFVRVSGSHHVELSDLRVFDVAAKDWWIGYGCSVNGSQFVTIRNCRFNHIYAFGVAFGGSTDCLVDGCDIGPWNFEDGIRFHNCQRITVQNSDIHNHETVRPGSTKGRKGHVDLIQIVRENHYITIRNNILHGSRQGIGGFSDHKWEGKRKGFRIEGNVIYDVTNKYHNLVMYRLEDPVFINNVLPHGYIRTGNNAGKVTIKNNIMGGKGFRSYDENCDYNLWINGSGRRGAHDLVGVDPCFVNAPRYYLIDKARSAEFTPSRLDLGFALEGKFAQGDVVEYFGDGVARRVTEVGPTWIAVDPPIANVDKGHDVWVANWKQNAELKPDYRLRPDSPAIDSGAGDVDRQKDVDGNGPHDVPEVANTGGGEVSYVDRGAYEYRPARNQAGEAAREVE